MSNNCSRPFRWRVRPVFEALEDRALLSGISPVIESLFVTAPSLYVSQQASGLDITVYRVVSGLDRHQQGVALAVPLTASFSASLGSTTPGGQAASLPASASDTFTSVNESITFPAGATSETVRIPINSGAANPGSVPIEISATTTSPGWAGGSLVVYLVTGPAALPPTPPPLPAITNSHLIFQGKTPSGISITFSQPMSPASVDDLQNYEFARAHPTTIYDLLGLQPTTTVGYSPVALKAAHYDPTTDTVTLIPKKPLKASETYGLFNSPKHILTDLQGNDLEQGLHTLDGKPVYNAYFAITLKGHNSYNFPAPAPPTIYSGN